MVSNLVSIAGYRISEELYNGSRTVVYRGYRETDSLPIVIKLLKNPYPGFSELLSFRNQYTIAKNLNSPLIIQTYSLEPYQNGYALVMEDFGGISLKDYFNSVKTRYMVPLQEFLQIAIALCNALDMLYRERIIHKDIKPSNILINPETKQVKLIDFSVASLLPRETQTLINPNILEGTLAYISPEQTGRMNRGIDYRTDFYSVGVTFYELLTGELPFSSNDAMELVHCHIAKPAPLVHKINPQISSSLSEIVKKLMSKNAEDRYQSVLGLKCDLENCLTQLQEIGKVESFKIAQRDVCDRFIIPDKLYGREAEISTLLQGFERVSLGAREMILVAGFSGIGKTAVVSEVHKPITRQRGYFIRGKYDQFNRNIPLSAFVQALRDLIKQLLSESDTHLQRWKTQILEAVGENGQVIIEVIPELENIIGQQPTPPELSGTAAQNRFNLLFQKFLQVFTKREHPLVIFLDDLQWADSASLNLIDLLMEDSEIGYLLLIGAYRDNEVSPTHPLMLTLDAVGKAGAKVSTIPLQPLSQSSLNHLVADTLNFHENLAQPLATLVYQKTKGNSFFATQFLKALHQDKLIQFDHQGGHWQCDIVGVKEAALTDDVVEFMVLQLQKLPPETQNILKLVACIGNQFDLNTVAIIAEKSVTETATALWKGLQEGLILPITETYKFFQFNESDQVNHDLDITIPYKFLHDRVQQSAYFLIPEDQKTATHLKIGQLLQQNSSETELEKKLFDIVNHLNVGQSLMTQPSQRTELSQLNLAAGRKAKSATAYSAAITYFTTGIELLPQDSWQSQYELTLALHQATAEVAYLSGQFEKMEAIASITLKHSKTLLDKITTYETQIQASLAQNRPAESVQTALNVLKQLSIHLPKAPTTVQTLLGLAKTKLILGRKKPSDLLNLPTMSKPEKLAAMRILASTTSAAFLGSPKLFPLLVFQQVSLSVQHGNSPLSAYAYACYGTILSGMLSDIDGGYEFGQLALQILEKFNGRYLQSKVLVPVNIFTLHWKQHLQSTLAGLQEGYQVGLETGDVECSAWCASFLNQHLYWSGHELSDLEQTLLHYSEAIKLSKQDTALANIGTCHQSVLNLLGKSLNPSILDGSAYSEAQNAIQEAVGDGSGLFSYYVQQTYLSYLLGEFESAVKQATIAQQYAENGISLFANVPFNLYDSLARLALYPSANKARRSQILRHVTQNQKKLQKWAGFAPMNLLHKFYLVEAERYRVLGKLAQAQEMYDLAISGAKENQYIQEEALSHELAAKFYLDRGKKQFAQIYITNAYYSYARWGAKAKVVDLEQRYPELLATVLQQPPISPKSDNFILNSADKTIFSSGTSISRNLDLATLFKACQALSSEIQFEKLLSALMQVVIESAGANKCALMLSKDKNLTIEAIATLKATDTTIHSTLQPSIPIELSQDIPISVINYVFRTSEPLVIDDAIVQTSLTSDPYFQEAQPQSLLCTPIINQGKLIGILYLENNLTAGAFTSDRLQVLNLLTTQAAISLENAQLYRQSEEYSHTLEEKVKERTQELKHYCTQLESTLEQLYSTQAQLIQSEKMSSLGQLVAGVAHEINNPVSFIYGNLYSAKKYIQDLVGLIQLYQQHNFNLVPELEQRAKAIDIDFLIEDLPKLLKSMEVGAERIREIVSSLRNFSRLDEAEMKEVNIHEGIDSTLMILEHRLKAASDRPAIKLIKEYGNLPLVECYPKQLNQVFMNIISNAIDALEEAFTNNKNVKDLQIILKTEVIDKQHVMIRILDNGPGISEELQKFLFDPFFTTKTVGKGTGLGLSLSYKIITEKHQGQLKCISQPGKLTEFAIIIPLYQSGVDNLRRQQALQNTYDGVEM